MSVMVKKIGPPEQGGNHVLGGFVKIGGVYETTPAIAKELTSTGEFEIVPQEPSTADEGAQRGDGVL